MGWVQFIRVPLLAPPLFRSCPRGGGGGVTLLIRLHFFFMIVFFSDRVPETGCASRTRDGREKNPCRLVGPQLLDRRHWASGYSHVRVHVPAARAPVRRALLE